MIPIGDLLRRRRLPVVNIVLIVVNIVVFVYEASLNGPDLNRFIRAYGVVPYEISHYTELPPVGPPAVWMTIFTSMFMHGGWLHLGGNMLYLWVFGDNIEDGLGHLKYLLFYLASGAAAAFAQVYVDAGSRIPSIGASGAVAGVLGAYMFLYPRAAVKTLVFFWFIIRIIQVPAFILIGIWILLQLFSGAASIGAPVQTGGVAYWAHIGGFIFGLGIMALINMFLPRRGRYGGERGGTWQRW